MPRQSIIIILLVLLVALVPVAAQDLDEAIPPCDADDFAILSEIYAEYLETYLDLAETLQTAGVGETLTDAHTMQLLWWLDVYPSLPHCAYALHFGHVTGRLIDEMLIALLLFDIGSDTLANLHFDMVLGIIDEFTEMNRHFGVSLDVDPEPTPPKS